MDLHVREQQSFRDAFNLVTIHPSLDLRNGRREKGLVLATEPSQGPTQSQKLLVFTLVSNK